MSSVADMRLRLTVRIRVVDLIKDAWRANETQDQSAILLRAHAALTEDLHADDATHADAILKIAAALEASAGPITAKAYESLDASTEDDAWTPDPSHAFSMWRIAASASESESESESERDASGDADTIAKALRHAGRLTTALLCSIGIGKRLKLVDDPAVQQERNALVEQWVRELRVVAMFDADRLAMKFVTGIVHRERLDGRPIPVPRAQLGYFRDTLTMEGLIGDASGAASSGSSDSSDSGSDVNDEIAAMSLYLRRCIDIVEISRLDVDRMVVPNDDKDAPSIGKRKAQWATQQKSKIRRLLVDDADVKFGERTVAACSVCHKEGAGSTVGECLIGGASGTATTPGLHVRFHCTHVTCTGCMIAWTKTTHDRVAAAAAADDAEAQDADGLGALLTGASVTCPVCRAPLLRLPSGPSRADGHERVRPRRRDARAAVSRSIPSE
jgi:hypothetical protein